MKKDKEYKIDNCKKKEIKTKCLKIKILFFFVIELILMLFFFYYITTFCQVYKKTKIFWMYDI